MQHIVLTICPNGFEITLTSYLPCSDIHRFKSEARNFNVPMIFPVSFKQGKGKKYKTIDAWRQKNQNTIERSDEIK